MMTDNVKVVPRHIWQQKSAAPSRLSEISDEGLASLVQQEEAAAFQELVLRHHRRFYAFAFRMLQRREESEDVVQSSFLKFWQRPQLWNPKKGARWTTWMMQIILNATRDHLRKPRRFELLTETNTPAEPAMAEAHMIARQQGDLVAAAMKELPHRQREALVLSFYEDLGNKEAAMVMGVSVKSLESLLVRGKEKLREMLKEKIQ